MRKIVLLSAGIFIVTVACAQQVRKLDQPMQTKSCKIKIEANAFIAKTFIELEYYNPQNVETEGLRYFTLRPGQVITGFQLELNGQYRDGSIEEKWKASGAYNAVVGKRIDPALLQMTFPNNYRLNIYPFAAKSSRKISITITEVLKHTGNGLLYELPMTFMDSVSALKIDVSVQGKALNPETVGGILHNYSFVKDKEAAGLHYEGTNIYPRGEVSFRIPVKKNQYHYLIESKNDSNYFSLRLLHDVPKYQYTAAGDRLAVFWDISASADLRNIDKEIHFLHSYLASNRINEVSLYTFNQELKHVANFNLPGQHFSAIRNRILNFKYGGSTDLSNIDLTKSDAGTVLIFSDAVQTRGKKDMIPGTCQVNFITSANYPDHAYMKKITEHNGGNVIDLHSFKTDSALHRLSQLENMLYEITADARPVSIDKALPIREEQLLITGRAEGTLQLKFGNHLRTASLYHISPTEKVAGDPTTFETIQMINQYEALQKRGTWQELLIFGLENRIVTSYTAFIVLERIEDYINYKIAPPKELEEECKALNYVYKTNYRKKEIQRYSKELMLDNQLAILNSKSQWWNTVTASIIQYSTTKEKEQKENRTSEVNDNPVKNTASAMNNLPGTDHTIAEVVVTSAFNTRRAERSTSTNAQLITSEQLNIVPATEFNNALAGKVSGIQVRSQSFAKLGATGEVRLRGESSLNSSKVAYVVNGTFVPDAGYINLHDVENVTILQGPNAAALFGPDAANGAIVVTLKKGRRQYYGNTGWAKYKLRNRQYIEYIDEIKKAGKDMFLQKFEQVKKFYPGNTAFYYDVAQLFFEYGLKQESMQIMEDGIETTNGARAGIHAAAYIFESWGLYKKAIELYQQIIFTEPLHIEVVSDLALCYFRDSQYQLALDTYNNALSLATNTAGNENTMSRILNEINALIAVHGDVLDLGNINKDIIRRYPADLYVSIENNAGSNAYFDITGPTHTSLAKMMIRNQNSNFYFNHSEILVYRAGKGKYRIYENSYDAYDFSTPRYHRIVTFKNYQQPDQVIEVQTVNMNGQNGKVEIGSVTW